MDLSTTNISFTTSKGSGKTFTTRNTYSEFTTWPYDIISAIIGLLVLEVEAKTR